MFEPPGSSLWTCEVFLLLLEENFLNLILPKVSEYLMTFREGGEMLEQWPGSINLI